MSPEFAAFEPCPDVSELSGWLLGRFGVRAELAEHRVWRQPSGALWIAHRDVRIPEGLSVDAVGMLVMREAIPRGQLSTPFIRRFCASATRNVCRLEGEALRAYLSGRDTAWVDEWDAGERIVFAAGTPLGRGRRRGDVLCSELSRPYRIDSDAPALGSR